MHRKTKGGGDGVAALVGRIQRTTCTGDIRDFLLHRLKHDKNPLPWNARPEAEQQRVIDQCTQQALDLVERVVRLVAADERRTLATRLVGFTATNKGEIKVALTLPIQDEALVALNHARAAEVLIVVADKTPLIGERRPARPSPDQQELIDRGPGEDGEGGDDESPKDD